MEPLSALGVAAAIVQFLDVAFKIVKECKEIRDDALSVTKSNKELEREARLLVKLRSELGSVDRGQIGNRRIAEIASGCATLTTELLSLLDYVRGGTTKIGTAKATWRAVLKRKPIESCRRLWDSAKLCSKGS